MGCYVGVKQAGALMLLFTTHVHIVINQAFIKDTALSKGYTSFIMNATGTAQVEVLEVLQVGFRVKILIHRIYDAI